MARPWHWVDPCLVSILTPWIPCSCSVCASTAATDSRLAVTCLPVAESHSVCLAVWSLFHGKCSLVGVTSYTWTCHYDRPIIRPFPQTSDPSKFPFFSLQFLIKKPHQCHPTISSSVAPFSSYPQSLPASESFPMNQLFASGGQSIGVSSSTSVLPTKWSSNELKTDLL